MPENISTMLNFRVKEDWAARLDAAAEMMGQTRSSFIRQSLTNAVEGVLGGKDVPVRPRLTPPRVPKAQKDKCPHPKESVVRLATGVRLCQVCGAKLR